MPSGLRTLRVWSVCRSFGQLPDFFQSFGIGQRADVDRRFSLINHADQISWNLRRPVERKLTDHMNFVGLSQWIKSQLDVGPEPRSKPFRRVSGPWLKHNKAHNSFPLDRIFGANCRYFSYLEADQGRRE